MVSADRLLQVRNRCAPFSCFHGGQPFGFGAEGRIGQLFLLGFKLRTRGGHVIARAEHLQVILQCFDAGRTNGKIFDLLIPKTGGRFAPGIRFCHLLKHSKSLIAASTLEQQLRQRVLQIRVARITDVEASEMVNRFATARRIFRDHRPVFCRQSIVRRIPGKHFVVRVDGFLRMASRRQQACLLQRLTPFRGREQHRILRGFIGTGTRGQPFETV
ncbi:hypothetical protein D3C72_851240 [compost metagenome]